jgi:hypothetical protein
MTFDQKNLEVALEKLFEKHVKDIGKNDFNQLPKNVKDLCRQFFIIGHGEGINTFKKMEFKNQQFVVTLKKMFGEKHES